LEKGKKIDLEFNDARNRFGFLLRRAYQVMRSSLENDPANKLGLTATQLLVLTIASGKQKLNQIHIARLLELDRTTTGLAIKNLEKGDLIKRERDPKDRRCLLIKATPKAKKEMPNILKWASNSHKQISSKLTKTEKNTLRRLLKKLAS